MLAQANTTRMTAAAFMDFVDTRPDERWELIEGVPVAMAGGTARHAEIAGNLIERLRPLARAKGCRAIRDIFVQIAANDGAFFDPDLVVRYGPMNGEARQIDDPVIVFEVLSPSTMNRDRGLKLQAYLQCPTLQTMVLVYQDELRVEVWQRKADGAFDPGPRVLRQRDEAISLPALDASLGLSAIYEGVDIG
jgi:Uma2 family endonuclease